MNEKPKLILCPYCGNTQPEPDDRCTQCGGYFDPLSLKITQQHMGPWFIRDRNRPFRPGASYEVIKKEIEKGRIKATTIMRGPTTRQFWSVARNVPGVAHLLGYCHACGAHCKPTDENCSECGEVFFAPKLRDNLGLAPAGADVQAKTKLSASGEPTAQPTPQPQPQAGSTGPTLSRFGGPALGATPSTASPPPAATPAPTPQPQTTAKPASPLTTTPTPPQTADQPVGSSILAGLRPDSAATTASADEATVTQATTQADRARQAMAWMTGEGEPDNLATAGQNTAPLPRSGSANVWTWVLIGINIALFAGVIFFAIIYFGGAFDNDGDNDQPSTPTQQNDNDNDLNLTPADGNGDNGADADANGTGNDQPIADVDEDDLFEPADEPAPNPPANNNGPTAEQQRWQREYDRAMTLANDGNYDEAIRVLENIQNTAPRSAQPAGLSRIIEQVKEQQVQARMRNMFEE